MYRFFPTKNDLKQLHAYYDVGGDGNISYEEFVVALSDNTLSERKKRILDKLWGLFDPEDTGKCKGEDMILILADAATSTEPVMNLFHQT